MEKLIDYSIVEQSTAFVVTQLLTDSNYNFFNNSEQKIIFDKAWITEFKSITSDKELNRDEILTLNRRKLASIMSHFSTIRYENAGLLLDIDYISSGVYQTDFNKAFMRISNKLVQFVNVKFNKIAAQKDLGNNTVEDITTLTKIVYGLSTAFSMPSPTRLALPNNAASSKLPANFTNTRTIFDDYYPLKPEFVERDVEYFKEITQKFELTQSDLQGMDEITLITPTEAVENESHISRLITQLVICPIKSWLLGSYTKVHFLDKKAVHNKIIPDYGIEVVKEGETYKIPMEIKTVGVARAYETRDKNSEFIELTNQVAFQMMSYNSLLGFCMDINTLVVFQFEKDIESTITPTANKEFYSMKLNISCFRSQDSEFGLTALVAIISDNYFRNIDIPTKESVASAFDRLRMTAEEKEGVQRWRREFLEKNWKTKFQNFTKNGDWFIHNTQQDLKLSESCYQEIQKLNFDNGQLNENDFEFICDLQTNDSNARYNSQVGKFKCVNPLSDYYLQEVVLKVYNPSTSPEVRGILPQPRFLNTLSFNLTMFSYEIRAYRVLRSSEPPGIDVPRPDTSQNEGDDVNCVPLLIDYGLINWSKGGNKFKGLFLLMEFINDDSHLLTKDELYRLGKVSLKVIHQKKVLHKDVHRNNFRYNLEKERVYFFDFGNSRIKTYDAQSLFPAEDEANAEAERLCEEEDNRRLMIACDVTQDIDEVLYRLMNNIN